MIAYVEDTVLEISDDKDCAEVMNAMRARVFGGELLEKDEKFDAIMAARKRDTSTARKARKE